MSTPTYTTAAYKGGYQVTKNGSAITAPSGDGENRESNWKRLLDATAGDPFYFPRAGRVRSNDLRGEQPFTSAAPLTLLSVPAGSRGVVRSIGLIFAVGTDLSKITLNITTDQGATPDVSLPVASLFGYENLPAAGAANLSPFDADLFAIDDPLWTGSTPTQANFGGRLRYPVPYTNGITITLSTSLANASVWSNIYYNDELPPCWNDNLRLRGTRFNNTINGWTQQFTKANVAYPSSSTIHAYSGTPWTANAFVGKAFALGAAEDREILANTNNTITLDKAPFFGSSTPLTAAVNNTGWYLVTLSKFLDLAGSGWLASVVGSVSSSDPIESAVGDVVCPWESNVRLKIDGETAASIESTGMEDFFGGSFVWESLHRGREGGIVFKDNAAYTFYRTLHNEPIRFTTGIQGIAANLCDTAAGFQWTTLYYLEQS